MEATFQRTGRILHLHAGGEVIRTTPEHPFHVAGEGWTAAGALRPGDRVATLSGEWVAVGEVFDTGEYEPVYNLRVADFHTYFVGDAHWGWAAWAHNSYADGADRSRLNAYIADFKGTLANKEGTQWLYPYHALNMSSKEWQTFQEKEGDGLLPMRDGPKWVYLLFDREQEGTNLEIMKAGKAEKETWYQRFGGDNQYRYLAILGAKVTIFAFDLSLAPNVSAETLEEKIRKNLWDHTTGTAPKHWLPYDGEPPTRPANSGLEPEDPYRKAVRRPPGTPSPPSGFDLQPKLAGTQLAGRQPVKVDLNRRGSWSAVANDLAANRRYVYVLEVRQETNNSPLKLLKVGVIGRDQPSSGASYANRLGQYTNTSVNYEGGSKFYYAEGTGVTAHIYDVTDLVGTQGTTGEQRARHEALEMEVRRALYGQGYKLPHDHEKEKDWRTPSDYYRRANYDG